MKEKIEQLVKNALSDLGISGALISVEPIDDFNNGDYTTNAAFVSGKIANRNPKDLAKNLKEFLDNNLPSEIEKIETAGAGFINFFLSKDFLAGEVKKIIGQGVDSGVSETLAGKKVMVEYTDPNPFKEFHIGHLMSNTIGEAISRLIESRGAEVKRACYQGDVGLHVAKALYGAKKTSPTTSADWGKAYALGATAYEENETAKKEIEKINQAVYERTDAALNKLYDDGRKVSLDSFETIYKRLGTHFDFYFFESEMARSGLDIVRELLKNGVFEKSEGAVVFKAEKYNPKLHTRVYITSQGLPTYETKELGLHFAKAEEYKADQSIVITANEQDSVFTVGLEALRHIDSALFAKTKHLSHGFLRMPSGKMASRKGNVITAEWLIDEAKKMIAEKMTERGFSNDEKEKISAVVAIGAIKYSILRQAVGGDIVFDFEKSISFEGDSGPYLMYAYVRAISVIARGLQGGPQRLSFKIPKDGPCDLLARCLVRFPDVVSRSADKYAPHHLVTYLTKLSSFFNNFYANTKIIGSPDEAELLAITRSVATTLKTGLTLLGMPIVERM